mmetsp:Transcript_2722/g.8753  ORF Transcript_2722/g.8753 Transcript_2722/m.8753 type:complete len:242 (-) Transcript_2722:163-888(-)
MFNEGQARRQPRRPRPRQVAKDKVNTFARARREVGANGGRELPEGHRRRQRKGGGTLGVTRIPGHRHPRHHRRPKVEEDRRKFEAKRRLKLAIGRLVKAHGSAASPRGKHQVKGLQLQHADAQVVRQLLAGCHLGIVDRRVERQAELVRRLVSRKADVTRCRWHVAVGTAARGRVRRRGQGAVARLLQRSAHRRAGRRRTPRAPLAVRAGAALALDDGQRAIAWLHLQRPLVQFLVVGRFL